MKLEDLGKGDPEIYQAIKNEEKRQSEGIELIPSENYTSQAVLEAMGTVLTNKYSEGYPFRRYYGGQKFIDIIESLGIERAKRLFKSEHANIQPYSGSIANLAAYFALINPGEKIMGMSLAHGGHLTHGHKASKVAAIFEVASYGVSREGYLDYEEVLALAVREKPKLIVAGATAYPREIDFKKFREIADACGAYLVADISHIAGLVVAGLHQSPVSFSDIVTTTTHKTLRGPRGGVILSQKQYAEAVDRAVFPGLQGGPLDHINAAKAVCFNEALRPEFKQYAAQVVRNAKVLAGELLNYGFNLVSGGTDNHLILIDLSNKDITGGEAEEILDKVGITCNKNMIPYDRRSSFDPSGIRIGTPAVTTRGMAEDEMRQIAKWIKEALEHKNDEGYLGRIKAEVRDFSLQYPVPGVE